MKAIQFATYGGPEVLKVVDLPEPNMASGQTLIRVKAAAVNPLDGAVRAGYFPIAAKPPLIPGEEGSGVVVRNGGQFKEGERVVVYGGGLGVFGNGTWAELVAVPSTSVRPLPEELSFEQGAALPNVGVTAYGALRTGGLKAGETLLVLGATGGVGSAGVQIGKALGARVIATVSKPDKASQISSLGADHVVALSGAPLAEQVQTLTHGKGADLVLDPVGGDVTGKALAALGAFGRLVHLGYSAGTTLTINALDLIAKPSSVLGFNIFHVSPEVAAKDLDEIMALAKTGKYRPLVDRTFRAEEVVNATTHLEQRKGAGKVVLTF